MSLTKFELQDIWHILQPQAINQEKTNKLLERIAIALERGNSLEHILSDSEKKLLCTCKDKKERKKK
jgi:hypothetical protein|tara:strand:+ start:101 stop:301 length:201 start_codon:yes stop_codon:yes gene_type:complete